MPHFKDKDPINEEHIGSMKHVIGVLFKTLLQFAFILVKMECVMMRSGRQGGHQHVIRNSILVKTIPGLSQL